MTREEMIYPGVYPCSFVQAAKRKLEDLPPLHRKQWCKVRTLGEALYGKVFHAEVLHAEAEHCCEPSILHAEANLADTPREVALKQMRRSDVLAGSNGLESAANEIWAAAALKHLQLPFTAKVHFVAQDKEHVYLATEYCAHGDLYTVLRSQGHISSDNVLREVLCQVLQALKALHGLGIAHRDLSLENLLVTADGSIRLIDFGQALFVHGPGDNAEEEPVPFSRLGLPGKPFYRAPEASLAEPYQAKKLDMFACGVLLYTLAFGEYLPGVGPQYLFPPEQRKSDRCVKLLPHLQSKGLVNRVSPGLLDLLEQLLAPNPDKRLTADEALMHPWLVGTLDGDYMPPADSDGEQCSDGDWCQDQIRHARQ